MSLFRLHACVGVVLLGCLYGPVSAEALDALREGENEREPVDEFLGADFAERDVVTNGVWVGGQQGEWGTRFNWEPPLICFNGEHFEG